jgi:hypothetical protein
MVCLPFYTIFDRDQLRGIDGSLNIVLVAISFELPILISPHFLSSSSSQNQSQMILKTHLVQSFYTLLYLYIGHITHKLEASKICKILDELIWPTTVK